MTKKQAGGFIKLTRTSSSLCYSDWAFVFARGPEGLTRHEVADWLVQECDEVRLIAPPRADGKAQDIIFSVNESKGKGYHYKLSQTLLSSSLTPLRNVVAAGCWKGRCLSAQQAGPPVSGPLEVLFLQLECHRVVIRKRQSGRPVHIVLRLGPSLCY